MVTESQQLVALSDNAEHARRRRPWTRAFSPAALKDYEPQLAMRVRLLVSRLSEQGSKSVEIDKWIQWFSYVCIGSLFKR